MAAAADLSDPASFADAKRGFIAAPKGQVKDEAGNVIWDYDAFAFVEGQAPATVNPSLWRQALLNNQVGLFKVHDRIWQLRGFDLANITLIEGRTGWIVVDTLTSRETAAAAMAFARQHLGDKPVSAVIFTHSHVDHFGGALGVIAADEAQGARRAGGGAGGLHGRGHQREPDDGRGHGPALDVHVRQPPAARCQRPGRHRPGQGGGLRARGHPRADGGGGPADAGGHARRPALRLPQRAGQRGAGRVHVLPAGAAGLLRRRADEPHAAQPVHVARRQGARRAQVGRLPGRVAGACRAGRGAVQPASLAGVGPRAHRRVHQQAARRLPLHPRPDGAADERRPHRPRRSPTR